MSPRDDLQDLYLHLEHASEGLVYMAWYGQCRAQGQTHREAIRDTVHHYGLEDEAWYRHRMANRGR